MSQRALWATVPFLAIVSLAAAIAVVAEEGEGALDGHSLVVEVTDPPFVSSFGRGAPFRPPTSKLETVP
jgi:hypothetical protein